MATIFALNYKNYLNRFADKEETLAAYLAKDPSYFMQANVNFKLGDGVNTYQVLGTNNEYNYLLVTEGDTILSHWYIMESTYLTKNQSRLTLLRDVVVDSWAALKDAPIYVDKGWVDYQNPLIFNTEGVGFNQVKKAEILLKDSYPCAWLVAYVATNDNGEAPTSIEGSAVASDTNYDLEVPNQGNITAWEYWKYCANNSNIESLYSNTYNHLFHIYEKNYPYSRQFTFDEQKEIKDVDVQYNGTTATSIHERNLIKQYKTYSASINGQVNGQVGAVSTAYIDNINELDGKIIRYYDGSYKFSRIAVRTITNHINETYLSAGALYNNMKNWVEAAGGTNINDKTLSFETDATRYYIELIDLTQTVSAKFTFDTTKQKLVDAPYYMVCMPYGDFTLHITDGGTSYNLPQTKEFAMDLMNSFVYNGQSWIYDYQLLPYCPISGLSAIVDESSADIYVDNYTSASIMKVLDGVGLKSIVFLAKYSKFSTQINMANNEAYNYLTKVADDAIERKVKNECELVRISSPSGSNSFDFNPQMNDGFDYIQVDCTYKPYSPYIHVAPDFAGLYGDNFGDTRGLIVQGDFSLPTLTNQWKEYEINNKNYANVFDRETQSLEFQEQKRRTQAGWSVAAGTLTGAVSSATTGAIVGGGVGAGVGAALGGAASLGAGLADYHISKELYAEQMSLRSDRFNYSLDNIKARPNGLAKTSAFTNNNKIFPFLEFYTATDTEKEALRQKIRYEGMKLGVVGTIETYGNGPEPHTYFRGTLIRLENYNADYHFIQALTNELMMGIFVPLEE